jgi:hypothetical protein
VDAMRIATEAYREDELPAAAPAGPGGVTWRAVAISLATILLSVPAIVYGEVVWGSRYAGDVLKTGLWSTDAPAAWPLTVLFLIAALMSLPVLRRIGLTRRELLTVHTAVLVATPPVSGLSQLLDALLRRVALPVRRLLVRPSRFEPCGHTAPRVKCAVHRLVWQFCGDPSSLREHWVFLAKGRTGTIIVLGRPCWEHGLTEQGLRPPCDLESIRHAALLEQADLKS